MLRRLVRSAGLRGAVLLGGLLATGAAQGQSTFTWVKPVTAGSVGFTSLAPDRAGGVVAAGYFQDTLQLGTAQYTISNRNRNGFVARVNAVGAVQWVQALGNGSQTDVVIDAVATDASGASYVAGRYIGTLTVGTTVLPAPAGSTAEQLFLIKLDPAGAPVWARDYGGAGTEQPYSLAVGPGGALTMVGSFYGATQLGAFSFTATGNASDAFIMRLDPTGTVQWARAGAGAGFAEGEGVVADAGGNVYVLGYWEGTVQLDGSTLTSAGSGDIFLAKYSPTGAMRWLRGVGGGNTESPKAVALDGRGGLYFTGQLGSGNVAFDTLTVRQSGTAMFLARYDTAGAVRWVERSTATSSYSMATGLDVDANGDVYLSGQFSFGTLGFGGVTLPQAGTGEGFVLKFGAAVRQTVWARTTSGPGIETLPHLTLSDSTPYVSGSYTQAYTLAGVPLPPVRSGAYVKPFLAQLTPCPSAQVLPLPIATPATVVRGLPVQLSVSNPQAGVTYTWTGPGLPATPVPSPSPVLTVTPPNLGANAYVVTVTTAQGCQVQARIVVETTAPAPCAANLGGSGCAVQRVAILSTTLNATTTICQFNNGSQLATYPASGATTATLQRGGAYQVIVRTAATGAIGLWLDVNRDGVYAANEFTSVTAAAHAGGDTVLIQVPITAAAGVAGLRIRTRPGGALTAADPCTNLTTGETLDFQVTLDPTPASPATAAPYCTPLHSSRCGLGMIRRVRLAGTTLDNASLCALNPDGQPYTNYPATGTTTATVQQAGRYQLTVETPDTSSVGIWVDWDHDNQFDISGNEFTRLYLHAAQGTMTLRVPPGTVPGPTRLRVRSLYNANFVFSSQACDNTGAGGETEDYTLLVEPGNLNSPAPYCVAPHPAGCGQGAITRVVLVGTTLATRSTCRPDTTTNAYTRFAALDSATAVVRAGSTYSLRVQVDQTMAVGLWADWNLNGTFDADEWVNGGIVAPGSLSSGVPLVVPITAMPTLIRLRIRARAGSQPLTAADACTTLPSGETEDYAVLVQAGSLAYCQPLQDPTTCGATSIVRVGLNTLNNPSGGCELNANGQSATYFPPTGTRTTVLERAVLYSMAVTAGGTYATNAAVGVWADWNRNGTFDNTEFLQLSHSSPTSSTYSGLLEVPANARMGTIRIRVRMVRSGYGVLSPCTQLGFGETEDYDVTIAAPYCRAPSSSGCSIIQMMRRVLIPGTTLDNVSTCQTDANGDPYTLFPPTGSATATLVPGQTYPLHINTENDGAIAAWVDWDRDSTFEVEEFTLVTDRARSEWVTSALLTVPANAVPGPTRLRIRCHSYNAAGYSATEMCTQEASGETEDYIITIGPRPVPVACAAPHPAGCGNGIITRVVLAGTTLDNASTCDPGAYSTYPPTEPTRVRVRQGNATELRVTTDGAGPVAAWIDWNGDETFAADEWIGSRAGTGTLVLPLTVPLTAAPRIVRLRVRTAPGLVLGSADACRSLPTGETEDYLIQVLPGNPYCHPSATSCLDGLVRVTLGGTPLDTAMTFCPVDTAGNVYVNIWPGPHTTATLAAGSTYPLGFVTSEQLQVGLWVDWNRNHQLEASEFQLIGDRTPANALQTVALTVPAGTLPGDVRLRLRASRGALTGGDACAFATVADTKDFTLTVAGPCAVAVPTISASGGVLLSSAATGNQWYFNGQPLVGATGPTLTPTQAGSYAVSTTAAGGCTSALSASYLYNPVGLPNDLSGPAAIVVYPNPVTAGELTVMLGRVTHPMSVTIYDATGRRLLTTTAHPTTAHTLTLELDVRSLPTGVYLLRATGADGQARQQRFVVE